MNPPPDTARNKPTGHPDVAALAGDWARAVSGTSYIPLGRDELIEFLRTQLLQLTRACRQEPFVADDGYRVAEQLITTDIASPEALGRTLALLSERLPEVLDLSDERRQARPRELLAALATGYSRGLCDRTLDAQEQIRQAALASRDEAVRALHASEARFRHAALHDQLTGLPNRFMLSEQLAQALNTTQRGKLVGLCMLNIDQFKVINDTHGHAVGDDLLRTLAQRLRRIGQRHDYVLARTGGDEFALLAADVTDEAAFITLVTEALTAIGAPAALDGRSLTVHASAGIVVRPAARAVPAEMLRAADVSLHWAKSDGGDRWVVHSPHRDQLQSNEYRLASQLRTALKHDQIAPVYQPITHLTDMSVLGAEALARWRHPRHGEIPPAHFVGLAEQTGQVITLGRAMLRQACRAAASWTAPLDTAFVSVNIAAPHVHDHDIAADVEQALADSGLDPGRLVVEITETLATHTSPEMIAKLRRIADMGSRIAVDDFGTGYSNFDYLTRLPVHVIKIDASFVKDLAAGPHANRQATAIVTTLIKLAHTLDLLTIAEGVETPGQAQVLRDLGCDAGQGWHLGDPQPNMSAR